MRLPIAVQVEPFEVDAVQLEIDAVRTAFRDYLNEVPRKSTRSKHGLMGPIGKILGEVKSGRRDAESLKGYAIRVHEAMGRSPSLSGMQSLERGVDQLVGLLVRVPVAYHDRLLDRLDHGLYFDLRKAALESKEVRRQAWIGFLRSKYEDEGKLSEAWGEVVAIFDDLYLPARSEGAKGKKATARQRDIDAFWESQGFATVSDDEEE